MSGNNKRRTARKSASIILSIMLCLTLMPVGAFAEAEDMTASEQTTEVQEDTGVTAENVDAEDAAAETTGEAEQDTAAEAEAPAETGEVTETQTDAEAQEETAGEEEPAAEEPEPVTAKSFKIGSYKVKMKSNVLVEQHLDEIYAPERAWIKSGKKNIKVQWTKPADSADIDGYIVLRKAGKEKAYKEIKKVSKTTYSYTDKKASKKNSEYAYIVTSYKKDGGNIHISPCSSWAAGVTTKSKLKNGYKATISKKSASLQVGGDAELKLEYSKPKTIFNGNKFRWYSDDESVATVSKGKVTAVAPGTTTVRGLLASGKEYKCKISVTGAFKPGTPKVQLDYSTTENIAIMWNEAKYATSYDVYCSEGGSENYELIANVTDTAYNHTGLEANKLYSYVVQARNDNGSYSAFSDNSAALEQKAVKSPRKTRVSDFPKKLSVKARKSCTFTINVTAPDGRTATVQEYNGKKWVKTKTTIKLPAGLDTQSVEVTLPDTWWKENTTKWRIKIPASDSATACTTGTLKLTTKRYYQNPKKYVQITNKISKHGLSYYTSPVLVNNMSTKKDHIEAMIKTAYKYLGDPYVVCQSRAPGKGVDCSGLVMQACYGAGVDLWPSNPYRHRSPAYEWESRNIAKHSNLKTVPYKNRKRGDLIFYANSSGTVIHVAIYLGNNKIIHSALPGVHVTGMAYPYGHVCKVKRIFN